MARVVKNKQLVNTRLAANYGGWMYCDKCNENIGYLCYATYDKLKFCITLYQNFLSLNHNNIYHL